MTNNYLIAYDPNGAGDDAKLLFEAAESCGKAHSPFSGLILVADSKLDAVGVRNLLIQQCPGGPELLVMRHNDSTAEPLAVKWRGFNNEEETTYWLDDVYFGH